MIIRKFIYTVIALSLASSLYGSDAERVLKSGVTPEKGSVGENFVYTLSIAGRELENISIRLPERGVYFPQQPGGEPGKKVKEPAADKGEETVPLYIIGGTSRADSVSEGMSQILLRVEIAYYRTGVHQLPELEVRDSDGVKIGYSIPSVTIEELNKEGKPEDIEPPLELSGNYTRWIIVILALAAAAAAVFFAIRYLRSRRRDTSEPPVQRSPLEVFLSGIEEMRLKECIEEGRVNDYVFGISIVFRRFLSMELGFDAAEMTTGEISSVIKKYLGSEPGFATGIIDIMDTWDLSKFAEFTLSKEVLSVNLENTISFARRLAGLKRGGNGEP